MHDLRWDLFKLLSRFGWWLCPEPERSRLYQSMFFDPNWKDGMPRREAVLAAEDGREDA